jgi:uncharacterized damage-inducible protein DinB
MKAHFGVKANYYAWTNRWFYEAAACLPEADDRSNLGAFFRPLHGTLNHLMTGDLLWLARFRRQAAPPFRLDNILHND